MPKLYTEINIHSYSQENLFYNSNFISNDKKCSNKKGGNYGIK